MSLYPQPAGVYSTIFWAPPSRDVPAGQPVHVAPQDPYVVCLRRPERVHLVSLWLIMTPFPRRIKVADPR